MIRQWRSRWLRWRASRIRAKGGSELLADWFENEAKQILR